MLLHAVLHGLGPVPHLAKVAVHLPHHRLAAVPHLAGDRVGAHRSPLVNGLEASTYMGAVERGETNISLDNLERIAKALNLTAGQLLVEAEKER